MGELGLEVPRGPSCRVKAASGVSGSVASLPSPVRSQLRLVRCPCQRLAVLRQLLDERLTLVGRQPFCVDQGVKGGSRLLSRAAAGDACERGVQGLDLLGDPLELLLCVLAGDQAGDVRPVRTEPEARYPDESLQSTTGGRDALTINRTGEWAATSHWREEPRHALEFSRLWINPRPPKSALAFL